MQNSPIFYANKALEYKQRIASKYRSIELDFLIRKLKGIDEILITTKYDGHFFVLVIEKEGIYFINSKQKVYEDPKLIDEVKQLSIGTSPLVLYGELYVKAKQRTRCFDTSVAIAEFSEDLCFAVFDTLPIDKTEEPYKNPLERYQWLAKNLPSDGRIHYAEGIVTSDVYKVQDCFKDVVDSKGLEGLVVKTKGHEAFKIKPKYTFDAVVVGFAEGIGEEQGTIRNFLMAFIKKDGTYQIIGQISNGFSHQTRREMFDEWNKKIVSSDFTEVASNKVAFHMVSPDRVMEFSCLDVLSENSSESISKMSLRYNEEEGYRAIGLSVSVSVVSMVFIRWRDDKEGSEHDVRFAQLDEIVELNKSQIIQHSKSEVIHREVYVKKTKDLRMVRKFVILKTDSKNRSAYPPYVFYYTDFSSTRAEPLRTEIKVAATKEAIYRFWEEAVEVKVKAGWELAINE